MKIRKNTLRKKERIATTRNLRGSLGTTALSPSSRVNGSHRIGAASIFFFFLTFPIFYRILIFPASSQRFRFIEKRSFGIKIKRKLCKQLWVIPECKEKKLHFLSSISFSLFFFSFNAFHSFTRRTLNYTSRNNSRSTNPTGLCLWRGAWKIERMEVRRPWSWVRVVRYDRTKMKRIFEVRADQGWLSSRAPESFIWWFNGGAWQNVKGLVRVGRISSSFGYSNENFTNSFFFPSSKYIGNGWLFSRENAAETNTRRFYTDIIPRNWNANDRML